MPFKEFLTNPTKLFKFSYLKNLNCCCREKKEEKKKYNIKQMSYLNIVFRQR